jgi:hypothetical protein
MRPEHYGSPRIHADLVEAGATMSVNTVADSMRRQSLPGWKPKLRQALRPWWCLPQECHLRRTYTRPITPNHPVPKSVCSYLTDSFNYR